MDPLMLSLNDWHDCTLHAGEEITTSEETDEKLPGDKPVPHVNTHYHLRGVVVHNGDGSGGRYYSFIRMR